MKWHVQHGRARHSSARVLLDLEWLAKKVLPKDVTYKRPTFN